MSIDYIPRPDADYNAWVANFVTFANANLAGLGLVAGDMTPVTTAQTPWNTAFAANIAAQATAVGARANKDGARVALTGVIRPLVRRLQASAPSVVSDQERASLGITIPDPSSTPVAPPTTSPTCTIGCGERLRQIIDFRDSSSPNSRAKPAGVIGAEVWVKLTAVGAPTPSDPADFDFLAVDTAAPYLSEYAGADGGKNANYILRWVNSRGQKGPWSEVFSATIGA